MPSEAARALRKRMTRQEVKLWVHLRGLKQLGYHFRRQSPLNPFIVDFECRRLKVIIEVDGGQHALAHHSEQDLRRDRKLQRGGYLILRFWNSQIDREIDSVMETILTTLSQRAHPTRLAPNRVRREPPSPKGEG